MGVVDKSIVDVEPVLVLGLDLNLSPNKFGWGGGVDKSIVVDIESQF